MTFNNYLFSSLNTINRCLEISKAIDGLRIHITIKLYTEIIYLPKNVQRFLIIYFKNTTDSKKVNKRSYL